jgi:hypothetical protein
MIMPYRFVLVIMETAAPNRRRNVQGRANIVTDEGVSSRIATDLVVELLLRKHLDDLDLTTRDVEVACMFAPSASAPCAGCMGEGGAS